MNLQSWSNVWLHRLLITIAMIIVSSVIAAYIGGGIIVFLLTLLLIATIYAIVPKYRLRVEHASDSSVDE